MNIRADVVKPPSRRRSAKRPPPGTVAARVQERLEKLNLEATPTSLAAGLGKDVIRDMLRRPHQSPTLRTIMALARILETAPAWLAFGDRAQAFFDETIIPVSGEVAAGLFRMVGRSDEPVYSPTPLPADTRFPPEQQFDLVVRGSSINKIARDGDYLRCVLIDACGSPANGELVVVEQLNSDGGVETTAKILRRRAGSTELWPESTDERWSLPLVITDDEHAVDRLIRVTAKVLFIYRPFHGARE